MFPDNCEMISLSLGVETQHQTVTSLIVNKVSLKWRPQKVVIVLMKCLNKTKMHLNAFKCKKEP